jgi:hypothetical protein
MCVPRSDTIPNASNEEGARAARVKADSFRDAPLAFHRRMAALPHAGL